MGLLDYADEYGKRFLGLLGNMPLVQLLKAGQGEAPAPDVSPNALANALKSIKTFDPVTGAQDAYNAGLNALTFAGVNAKTANKGLLESAQKMDAAGVDRAKIWNDTGWFKGPDQKWRFEIDDGLFSAVYKRGIADKLAVAQDADPLIGARVEDVLRHPGVYGAYPDTAGIRVDLTRPHGGAYGAATSWGDPEGISAAVSGGKSTLLHELQHAIQEREGFAKGGSPNGPLTQDERRRLIDEIMRWSRPIDDAAGVPWMDSFNKSAAVVDSEGGRYRAYQRLAGEAEARAVQSRMDMNAAQRQATPPWESYDIPWDQLIVRYR